MATLDVSNVKAVTFTVATVVTAPDGNTFSAVINQAYGVPKSQTSMTVDVLTPVLCQTHGTVTKVESGVMPFFTVDEVRTPVV